jgi:hypothetical protein
MTENLVSFSRLFADDTSLLDSSPDLNELDHTLNTDLCTLNEWAACLLVKFNKTKTEVLLYDENNRQISLRFGDSIIGNTKSHMHLGITFDT